MSVDEKLLAIFRQEAGERLDGMVQALLAVEAGRGDAESVLELFRHAHSLKGTAGMVGLEPIARMAGAVEDVLSGARVSGELDRELVGPLLKAADAIRAAMDGEPFDEAAVAALLPTEERPQAPVPPTAAVEVSRGAGDPAPRTLRVPAGRVDELLDAAGEAVLHRRRLEHLLAPVAEERVLEELEHGESLLDELQHAVLDLRTMPLSSIVGGYPRAVRDIAATVGREVELVLEDVDVQLDRTILEGIADPIVHLLRNAVSHGIEAPEEREKAGKPRVGRVVLRAESRGARVTVTVADDGRGVAPDLVAQAAGSAELAELLARPGFSTADHVDALSGRGVGLDAVRRDVERLGGGLVVTSEPGTGAEFELRLPVTLAVLHVLLVERGPHVFGLPVATVEEALQECRVLEHGGRRSIEVRGATVPLADLADLLSADAPALGDWAPILVTSVFGRRAALQCDRLVGEGEVVVKPLGSLLAEVPGYLGATIVDDGRIALILDVRHLVRTAAAAPRRAAPAAEHLPVRVPRLLVVDDQPTVRELQRTILGSAGYEVLTARDGREALEILEREDEIDLVLTDVEMPVLDGFGLLAALRDDPALASLPVVIVSSRGDEAHRRRGSEAGADAYVVKSEFDQRSLLETVRRLVIR